MPRIALVLAGCGYLDGAEIQEAVCSLLALDRAGFDVASFAPDQDQMHVVDHRSGEEVAGSRNVLAESARIVRGAIDELGACRAEDFDALWLPGGFGVAKNLCSFAVDGADCSVDERMAALVQAFHAAGKPIVGLCIAPALLAKVLGDGVELTLGTDAGFAAKAEACGARHVAAEETEVVVDTANRIVTTPCYLFDDATVGQIAESAEIACAKLQALLGVGAT